MDDHAIPEQPVQRREWIKFQLRLRGTNLSAIARELGVSRQALRQALIQSYPKMERAIAAKLEMRAEDLWPERYARRHLAQRPVHQRPSFHVKRHKHNIAVLRRKDG